MELDDGINQPPKVVVWCGRNPTHCDTCAEPIKDIFFDTVTQMGPWGCICPSCFTLGPSIGKLGVGFGQKYVLQENNTFLKVAG